MMRQHTDFQHDPRSPTRPHGQGFTLVEAVLSILIVGLMLVAALNTIGASRLSQSTHTQMSLGPMLAQDLMTEILTQAYEEPNDTPEFGRESESGGDRQEWDDVDDYDGWSASPPEDKSGNTLPDLEGWGREVTVGWVNYLDLNKPSLVENGIKRIDVKVTYLGRTVTTLSALRTSGWDSEDEQAVPINVLMYVRDPDNLTTMETDRITLLESMGYNLNLLAEDADSAAMDTAHADNDVVYVPAHISIDNHAKLEFTTTGIVNGSSALVSNIGFSNNTRDTTSDTITIQTASHFITSTSVTGDLVILTAAAKLTRLNSGVAGGIENLAQIGSRKSFVTLEVGATRNDGSGATSRRARLPWGNQDFDINLVNDAGKDLLDRSLIWAAGKEDDDSGGAASSSSSTQTQKFVDDLMGQ